ncbi:helix-turn-helix domain-containing protein [Enterococcus hirae]|uniref:helix-turn-helix domain-containing protein n=1 Tax=Enterococcus TaxID=1350 RepID=UPI001E50529E|nr:MULTISPECIES: helix-turn-helix domain-containing protein [Enterococcus]UQR33325.1 helix-turn-helix domain-containing protein [Enterococcus hirae]
MSDEKKSYYAIIPANVRYDKRLMPNSKLLYGEITALCNEKGYCWAGNEYFANLYGVSKETISRWIGKLIEFGYLKREIVFKEGTNEIANRYLQINQYPIDEIINTSPQKDQYPIDENVKDNNTLFNNTNNNIDHSSSKMKNDFDKLWKLYPRKKGKTAAFKHYKKAIKDGATNKQIQDGILSYKKEIETKKIEESYIKHGSTWFSNRGWEDEYDYSVNTKKTISDEIAESQRRIAEAYEQ